MLYCSWGSLNTKEKENVMCVAFQILIIQTLIIVHSYCGTFIWYNIFFIAMEFFVLKTRESVYSLRTLTQPFFSWTSSWSCPPPDKRQISLDELELTVSRYVGTLTIPVVGWGKIEMLISWESNTMAIVLEQQESRTGFFYENKDTVFTTVKDLAVVRIAYLRQYGLIVHI